MANKVVICGIDTSSLPKCTNEKSNELLTKIKQGDSSAQDEFVMLNIRLVLSIIQRFNIKSENADDIFQVGMIGLIKSIENFDMSLGVKFSTYAVPMIIGEIRRFMRDNNAVKVSRNLRDIAYKAMQAKQELLKTSINERYINCPGGEAKASPPFCRSFTALCRLFLFVNRSLTILTISLPRVYLRTSGKDL